jgi:hypothetical protein
VLVLEQAPQIAKEGRERGENYFCVNQWHNHANRMAHYLTTGVIMRLRARVPLQSFCSTCPLTYMGCNMHAFISASKM